MENIISCLTNAYRNFSLEDVLRGVSRAGFRYVELLAEPAGPQWVHPDMALEPLREKLTKNSLKVSSLSALRLRSIVICCASSHSLPYGHVFTSFTFADNVIAFAEAGWDMPESFPFTMAYTALFEKGVVEFNSRAEKTLAIYTPGRKVEYPEVQQPPIWAANTEGNIVQLGGYFSEIKYFVHWVENDQEPAQASARAARDSLKVALTEKKSAETGKIIKIR